MLLEYLKIIRSRPLSVEVFSSNDICSFVNGYTWAAKVYGIENNYSNLNEDFCEYLKKILGINFPIIKWGSLVHSMNRNNLESITYAADLLIDFLSTNRKFKKMKFENIPINFKELLKDIQIDCNKYLISNVLDFNSFYNGFFCFYDEHKLSDSTFFKLRFDGNFDLFVRQKFKYDENVPYYSIILAESQNINDSINVALRLLSLYSSDLEPKN